MLLNVDNTLLDGDLILAGRRVGTAVVARAQLAGFDDQFLAQDALATNRQFGRRGTILHSSSESGSGEHMPCGRIDS